MRFLAALLIIVLQCVPPAWSTSITLSETELNTLKRLTHTDIDKAISVGENYLSQTLDEHSSLAVAVHYCTALNTDSRYQQVTRLLTELRPWMKSTPHLDLKAKLVSCEAIAAESLGNLDAALALVNNAISELDTAAYPYAYSELLVTRSVMHNYGGNYNSAVTDQAEAMSHYQRSGQVDKEHEMRMASSVGIAYGYLELHLKAADAYKKAAELAQQQQLNIDYSILLYNVASSYAKADEPEQSYLWAQRSLEVSQQIGDKTGAAYAEMMMANSLAQRHQYQQALAQSETVLLHFQQQQEQIGEMAIQVMRARWLNQIGEYQQALSLASQAMEFHLGNSEPYAQMQTASLMAEIYENLGDIAQTLHYTKLQLELHSKIYNSDVSEQVSRAQAELQLDLQQKENQLLRLQNQATQAELATNRTKQNATIIIAIGAGLFVVVLSIILVRTRRLASRLAHSANIDALTQIPNRRYFMQQLQLESMRSLRIKQAFSLAVIDVDHFKAINDTHGHQFGDDVLKQLGELLLGLSRGHDVCARYGGEEFLVLMPQTSEDEAFQAMERVRLASMHIETPQLTSLSISIGIAECNCGCDVDELLGRADRALYFAKENGRNQTVKFSTLPKVLQDKKRMDTPIQADFAHS